MRSTTPLIEIFRPSLLIALGALCFAAVGAHAQNMPEVTVTTANKAIKTIGHDNKGTPIRQLTATARVQYNPIMLTTSSGRALLNGRVAQVARDLCSDGGLFSNTDDDLNCVRGAVQGAKTQIDAEAERIGVSSR